MKTNVFCIIFFSSVNALDVSIYWPPMDSRHATREVPLRFGVSASDGIVCVAMKEGDGSWATLACDELQALTEKEIILRELLPGRRDVAVEVTANGTKARAVSSFVVGTADGDPVDLMLATTKGWAQAVPGAETVTERRQKYFGAVYDTKYWSAQGKMDAPPSAEIKLDFLYSATYFFFL